MDAAEQGRLLAGRYRLAEVIGRGGMGVVWRGHDELLGRDVAVKEVIWPPHLTEREQQVACRRATREAQMAGRLTHANVVRVYDIVEEDGHPCIVMEFIPDKSLRDLIAEEGPLPPDRAARIGLGILGALTAAHAQGILHRDVKPANILVGPDGRAVLTDFGIARAEDSPTLTADGTLLGSPSYIAPERARGGRPGTGAPADLWGLGASLYAAVEGRPPFERVNALATLTAVVSDEPDPAPHAGPLEPVISGLLRKDPERRLGPAEAERLLRLVAETPLPSLAAAPPAATRPGPSRAAAPAAAAQGPRRPAGPGRAPRRGLLVALTALVAAAGTGLAVALTSSPGPRAAPPGHEAATSSGSVRPAAPHPVASHGTAPSASPARTPGGASGPGTSPPPGAPSGSAADGSGALPAGYYRLTNSTGFSIGVPDGWRVSRQGQDVYLNDPADSNVFLLIDQSGHPKPNPLADWEQQQANRKGSYPDYRLISLRSVDYPQAEAAADWEFTYLRKGVLVHILNRNVLANQTHAYALYWSAPESEWNADYHYFQAFAATFRPAPVQPADDGAHAGHPGHAKPD